MARTPHPDKDIEKALRVAEESGWRVERSGSHAWGKIYCPYNNADCRCGEFCITRVWSTPRKPGNHARAAMLSALADVQRALPEAKLIEAAPDLVGLTDIANLIGVTRQNMRKLMLGHGASFPAPLHEGSASVWHLADIL